MTDELGGRVVGIYVVVFVPFALSWQPGPTEKKTPVLATVYYRNRGSASYMVREVRSVRERD